MQSTTTQPEPIEPTAEEKELDRRLIAAFMSSNQDLLSALCREDSSEAINARAAEIGLTTELMKRCRLIGTVPQMRKCIKCDARFLSAGPHNRLCKRCPPR